MRVSSSIWIVGVLFSCAVAAAAGPVGPKRGWFGVALKDLAAPEAATLDLAAGLPRVTRVFDGSPAQKAGVRVGDVVVSFEGRPIANTQALVRAVGGTAPGTAVVFVVKRGRREVTLRAVLDLRVSQRRRFLARWMGRQLPELMLAGARPGDGPQIRLGGAATAGKVLVLDYFATWCGPCKRVMPELEALQRTYGKRGLAVIGVSGEEAAVVQPFLAQNPLEYRVGLDTKQQFAHRLEVSVLPTLWVVDRQGTILEIYFGSGHHDQIEAAVRQALGLQADVSIEQPSLAR